MKTCIARKARKRNPKNNCFVRWFQWFWRTFRIRISLKMKIVLEICIAEKHTPKSNCFVRGFQSVWTLKCVPHVYIIEKESCNTFRPSFVPSGERWDMEWSKWFFWKVQKHYSRCMPQVMCTIAFDLYCHLGYSVGRYMFRQKSSNAPPCSSSPFRNTSPRRVSV